MMSHRAGIMFLSFMSIMDDFVAALGVKCVLLQVFTSSDLFKVKSRCRP